MQAGFWKKLKKPIMVMAPMSGVTDDAFRQMFLKYGKPSVFWTEFVPVAGFFSKGREHCLRNLKFAKQERPIVAQIFGADPVLFEGAAKEIVKLGFDGVDINMGCPDYDVEKKGGGSALIKNFELAGEIIQATKRGAGKLPVSVKTRIGYGKNQINDWIAVLLKQDVAALTVHLRTRDEMYRVSAHWELAKEIVKLRDEISPKTIIIGNGDVKSLEDAHKLVKETGMDGVMVGRSMVGNPWFFTDKFPTVSKKLNAVVEHAKIFEKIGGHNFDSLKKHFHSYAKGFNGAKEVRESLMKTKSSRDVKKIVEDFLK